MKFVFFLFLEIDSNYFLIVFDKTFTVYSTHLLDMR